MSIKAVLFDLDGTLLPLDQRVFISAYYRGLVEHMIGFGYDPDKLLKTLYNGVGKMIDNDGSKTNEEVFWQNFEETYGEGARKEEEKFAEFYKTTYQDIKNVVGFSENSKKIIDLLKEKGIMRILATNPLFPKIATESRVKWAGLEPCDFALITTFENINYCKPNLDYYTEILSRFSLKPEECIMVGNDVSDDMVARKLKMKVFLLTDCLINDEGTPLSLFPHGNFADLEKFLLENI